MRYSAKFLSLVVATCGMVSIIQIPSFLGKPLTLLPLALAQHDSATDRLTEANQLRTQGIEQYNAGQFEEALRSVELALQIYREIGVRAAFPEESRSGEAITLNNLGILLEMLRQYEDAISFTQQSLAISREIGNILCEFCSLLTLGNAYDGLNQYSQAIDFYEQALKIAQELGDRDNESRALSGLGSTYYKLGQYGQAINLHQQALALRRDVGAYQGVAASLGSLANIYSSLGQYQRSLSFYQEALEIDQRFGVSQFDKAVSLEDLGTIFYHLREYERAIDFLQQSLAIKRAIGSHRGESASLNLLGLVYYRLEQYSQALDFYHKALGLDRENGNRNGESKVLGNLGNLYHDLAQYERAIYMHKQALVIAQETSDRQWEALTQSNLGRAYLNNQQFAKAEAVLYDSIDNLEALRTNLSDNQLISLTHIQAGAYRYLSQTLIAQGKTIEALTISERSRSRAFLLQLAERLSAHTFSTPRHIDDLTSVPDIAAIQRIARNTNSTLVEYELACNQALNIWVVQPSGTIIFRTVDLTNDSDMGINPIASLDGPVYRSASAECSLAALAKNSRASIAIESTVSSAQLNTLHQVLIDPIADLLPTDPEAKVVFVPQGNLFLVPFAALQDAEGTYLIEKHTILTAPSIQVFGLANEAASTTARANGRSPFSADNALVVGNPTMPKVWSPTASGDFAETQLTDLPGAKAEAEAISGFLNITPLIGSQATEARVKQLLPSARLIHLATHGLLDYGDPRAYGRLDVPGAIALTPDSIEDGLLTSAEILEMDLQAELAVLSACDTGRGRITGDGVVGLSRALITGCPAWWCLSGPYPMPLPLS